LKSATESSSENKINLNEDEDDEWGNFVELETCKKTVNNNQKLENSAPLEKHASTTSGRQFYSNLETFLGNIFKVYPGKYIHMICLLCLNK